MGSLTEIRNRQVQEGVADPEQQMLPCAWCGTLATRKTLAELGARCAGCYAAYCAAPQASPPSGDKSIDPRGWAKALRRREQAGERLSLVQRSAWRDALGVQDELA